MDRIKIGYPAGYLRFCRIRVGFGYSFLKKIGPGYLFDFYNELSLRVIQDVTNDGGRVFFAMVFIFTNNQNVFVNICLLHSSQSKIIRYTLSKIFSSVKRNF